MLLRVFRNRRIRLALTWANLNIKWSFKIKKTLDLWKTRNSPQITKYKISHESQSNYILNTLTVALKLGHRCQSCPALLKLECDPWLHFSEHVGNCFSNHSNGVFIKYQPYSLLFLEQSCNLPWQASPLMKHWILSCVDSCLIITMHLYRSNYIKTPIHPWTL